MLTLAALILAVPVADAPVAIVNTLAVATGEPPNAAPIRLAQVDAPGPPIVVTARSAMRVGMNLAGLSNYSAELPFIDYLKLGGDPTQGQLSIPIAPGPTDLVMTYEGGTVVSVYDRAAGTANAIGWNAMQPTRWARGRVTFHSDAGGSVNLTVTHVNPADPIRNIHFYRASDEAAFKAGEFINPDFTAFIKVFPLLRTMDWTCTNGSPLVSWAERPKVGDPVWHCAPLEAQIAVANKAHSELWLNIPAHADDAYIRQAVSLVHDTLDPSLKLHLEYSNEVWNSSFEQSKWAQAQADQRWGGEHAVPWGQEQWAGYRSAQMASIARDVFGTDAARRLAVVYATFPHWGLTEPNDAFDKGVALAGKGSVAVLFREYATTTYFGGEFGIPGGTIADQATVLGWVLGGAGGLDKAFQQLEHGNLLSANGSLDFLKSSYPREAARAKAKGLDLVAYEGGLHISFFGTDHPTQFIDFVKRMTADPRMKGLYTRMVGDFAGAGGRGLAVFNDVGSVGVFGAWGTAPDLKSNTPRLEALRALSGR